MSKSAPDIQSRILLTDTYSQITSKIRAAVTDSIPGITYDPLARPGTSNLLTILAACTGEDAAKVAGRYEGLGHGKLKTDVAEAVECALKGPREEFARVRMDTGFLLRVAREGAEKARVRSEATMRDVRSRVGLP
jgi:tryptophanyl-tRNA synthetase